MPALRSLAATAILLATLCAHAQAPPQKPITFEVASIRRSNEPTIKGPLGYTPDGWVAGSLPLITILDVAFRINETARVQGLPSWATEMYQVNAKVAEADIPAWKNQTSDNDLTGPALQALLQDRFHLKTHYEIQDAPVYALVVAKGGPKFKPAAPGDTYPNGLHNHQGKPIIGLGYKCAPEDSSTASPPLCQTIGQAALISDLVQQISIEQYHVLGRMVVDKTGLTGVYDFTMPDPPYDPHPDANDPTIFTLLPEYLGLRLVPDKAPIQFLVIDHIERPTEN